MGGALEFKHMSINVLDMVKKVIQVHLGSYCILKSSAHFGYNQNSIKTTSPVPLLLIVLSAKGMVRVG
jgi:hypothetical protein